MFNEQFLHSSIGQEAVRRRPEVFDSVRWDRHGIVAGIGRELTNHDVQKLDFHARDHVGVAPPEMGDMGFEHRVHARPDHAAHHPHDGGDMGYLGSHHVLPHQLSVDYDREHRIRQRGGAFSASYEPAGFRSLDPGPEQLGQDIEKLMLAFASVRRDVDAYRSKMQEFSRSVSVLPSRMELVGRRRQERVLQLEQILARQQLNSSTEDWKIAYSILLVIVLFQFIFYGAKLLVRKGSSSLPS